MTADLTGSVALVTGGNSGIGRATADPLAALPGKRNGQATRACEAGSSLVLTGDPDEAGRRAAGEVGVA
jgi:NAD(P)-dependent dehydrogenase (short-subunit alcohol dehydrogenase family)